MLKATQYIHKIGKWDEYCEYIKESAKWSMKICM
jgi:hypothetical protein